jgi:hypothetical protein
LSEVGTSYDDFRWCQAPLTRYAAFLIFLSRVTGGIKRFLAHSHFECQQNQGEKLSPWDERGLLGWRGLRERSPERSPSTVQYALAVFSR